MKVIKLSTAGYETIVDNDLFDELNQYRWGISKWKGFPRVQRSTWINGKGGVIRMSRQIMGFPEGMVVDHINHNVLDNRRCNLRVCTQQQNLMNRGKNKVSQTGIKGVSFLNDRLRNKPWMARIKFNGKAKTLGVFHTAKEAHVAYKKTARKLFGEFAYTYL